MAISSVLRRASTSVLSPLAARAIASSSSRTFHYAASSSVRTVGLSRRLVERILLPSVRLANSSFATKTSADESLLRVLDSEIQCAQEEAAEDDVSIYIFHFLLFFCFFSLVVNIHMLVLYSL